MVEAEGAVGWTNCIARAKAICRLSADGEAPGICLHGEGWGTVGSTIMGLPLDSGQSSIITARAAVPHPLRRLQSGDQGDLHATQVVARGLRMSFRLSRSATWITVAVAGLVLGHCWADDRAGRA